MIVVLLGLIGAGKGTQAKMLVESNDFLHISTGDMFRDAVKNQTDLGKIVEGYMNDGALVPDEITIKMLLERLASSQSSNDLLLDGFPRTTAQCDALDNALVTNNLEIDCALNIDVDENILLDRIAKRASIENRQDDDPEIAKQRLENQRTTLQEVANYYDQKNKLLKVDGLGSVEEVHQRVLSVLEKKGS
ncbi:MAG: adenylate kinase [Chloroflexi bacterium]|nr:adenylate kinase [Chloroflexota bacterium]|tara:strand:- start:2712 stop:3284 length:573 start_codon:yes stop_codon:yes gene_type:complete